MRLDRRVEMGVWTTLAGVALFTGMMAAGYYYNVTFVQLGLIDLGERVVGLDRQAVATHMAALAGITSLVALGVGWSMARVGWSSDFRVKLRLAFAVVVLQTLLTAIAPGVRTPAGFLAWIVVASLALGVGVPVTFAMTVDLIPRRHRGLVAGIITALVYFAAPIFSYPWRVEGLSRQMLAVMAPGAVGLGLLALWPNPLTRALAGQHAQPDFYYGRFLRVTPGGEVRASRRILVLAALMFGVFFIDSLGFVRLADTPSLIEGAWQSPALRPRLTIAIVHVLAGFVAGVLYTALEPRGLFLWVFGIFALVHLLYTFPFSFGPVNPRTLSEPILYAIAVSLYTVMNFALWADLSTARTISRNAALGVALSGWSATFLSTALAIRWENAGMPVETHLRIVDSVAVLFFLAVLLAAFFGGGRPAQRAEGVR